MATQIFDDGSTLTWDENSGFVAATNATDPIVNRSYSFSPGGVSAGATSWDDVLRNGLSRLVDAKVRSLAPANTVPIIQPSGAKPLLFNGDAGNLKTWLPWVLIAGGAWVVLKALK